MTIVAEDLVRIEKRLELGAIEPEDYPPLLKVVRHFLRCGERRRGSTRKEGAGAKGVALRSRATVATAPTTSREPDMSAASIRY